MIKIRLPLAPVPASRPRVTRTGISYYTDPYKSWKKAAREMLTSLAPSTCPLLGRLSVSIRIFGTRPATTKLDMPRPDVDNYAKAVLDAGNSVLWDDDRQVAPLIVDKEWAKPGETGYVDIEIN